MNTTYIWLNLVFNNNYSEIKKILSFFDSNEDIINFSQKKWNNFELKENIIKRLNSLELKKYAEELYKKCQKENINIINYKSPKYPKNLLNISSYPIILFAKGQLDAKDDFSISIVGSRKNTDYGRIVTSKISGELASLGITIISGMARGIDSIAHQAALSNFGRTIAILACGVNVIYPAENKKLYNNIQNNGAILSEFNPDTPPLKQYFPIRNRIISGISLGTLVVEASAKSGSMITANFAGEQGKEIFAVPGNILSIQSEGTNNLIKDGAKIVTKTEDILEEFYGELKILKNNTSSLPALSNNEKIIFELINFEPISVENIFIKSQIPLNEINSILTILELSGYIKKTSGNSFVREDKYINLINNI